MRIEFLQKIQDMSEEELDYQERMGIEPKDKRHKWRKVLLNLEWVHSVYEANEKETVIEYGEEKITVKGGYDDVVNKIIEMESEEYDENQEEDLILDGQNK